MSKDLVNICIESMEAIFCCKINTFVMYKINLPCTLSSSGIVVIGPESVVFTLLHLLLLGSLLISAGSPKGSPAPPRGSPPFSSGSSASSFGSSPLSEVSASAG